MSGLLYAELLRQDAINHAEADLLPWATPSQPPRPADHADLRVGFAEQCRACFGLRMSRQQKALLDLADYTHEAAAATLGTTPAVVKTQWARIKEEAQHHGVVYPTG